MEFVYYFVTAVLVGTFFCVRTEWVQIPFQPASQIPTVPITYDEMDLLNRQLITDKNKDILISSAAEKKHLESTAHRVLDEDQSEDGELKNETINMFSKNFIEKSFHCSSTAYDKSCYKSKGKYKYVVNEEVEQPLKNVHEEILQEAEKHPHIKSKLVFLDDMKNKIMGHVGKLILFTVSAVILRYNYLPTNSSIQSSYGYYKKGYYLCF